MANWVGLGAKGAAVLGTVGVAGVAALGYLAFGDRPSEPSEGSAVPVVQGVAPPPAAPAPTDRAVRAPAPDVPPGTAKDAPDRAPLPGGGSGAPPETATPATRPEAPSAPDPAPAATVPDFDVVRVEPDGSALIAGRAKAGARVAVLLDGAEIGAADADAKGGFVALLGIAPADRPRVLSLLAHSDGQSLPSAQTVILTPTADALLAAAAPPVRGQPAPGMAEPAGDAPPVAAGPAAPPDPAPPSPETATAASADAAEDTDTPAADADAGPQASRAAVTDPGPPVDGTLSLPDVLAAPEPVGAGGAPVARQDGHTAQADAPQGPQTPLTGGAAQTDAAAPGPVAAGTAPSPPGAGDAAGQPPARPGPADAAPDAAQAPRLLMADDDGLRVIQDPGADPQAMSNVSIDTITYDAGGQVVLGGRGRANGFIRVYLDNDPIRTSRISPEGQWRADLPQIDARVYTLRVDEITEVGDVVSRAETPFRPETAEAVEAAAARSGATDGTEGPISVVTVQPGFTLWGIARENYGAGRLYVRVFEANADKIRDPDLIYPGQIFTVPE